MDYYKNKDLNSIWYMDELELKQEIWKDIPEYSGYQASDLGRIKSKDRVIQDKNGVKYNKKGIIMSLAFTLKGYLTTSLKKDDGVNKSVTIHRLIIKTFKGESDLQVDHINRIRHDNRVTNLRYCTSRENSVNRINVISRLEDIGVRFNGISFTSIINIGRKAHNLGSFKTREEASKKYKEALYEWEEFGKKPPKLSNNYTSSHEYITFNRDKWHAKIKINDRFYYTGHFETEKEAIISQIRGILGFESSGIYPVNRSYKPYKGTQFEKRSGKWLSRININGRIIQIGRSFTQKEAYQKILEYKKQNNLD